MVDQETRIKTTVPTPKQNKAHLSISKDLLYGGAKGGGKSYFLCNEAFRQCLIYPGNRLWMGRKRGKDFANTTLKTFFKVIDPRLYIHKEQKQQIIFPRFGNSVIEYGCLEKQKDLNKFNSAEYGGGFVDQAEEMTHDDFAAIRGTLRWTLPDGSEPAYQMRLTANPAISWLKKYFITNPASYTEFIQALPTDNPHLRPGYVSDLKETFEYRPELLQAYLKGSWDELEGANVIIKQAWVDKAVNMLKDKIILNKKYRVVGVDVARYGDDETVIYVLENRRIIDQMIYGKKDTEVTAFNAIEMRRKHDASYIAVDGDGLGVGVCDKLKTRGEPLLELHGAGAVVDKTLHLRNCRAEMWWNAMEMFAGETVSITDDTVLKNQLSTVWYESTGGIITVADKDEIKSALNSSPDRADALVYALWACKHYEAEHRPPQATPKESWVFDQETEDKTEPALGIRET